MWRGQCRGVFLREAAPVERCGFHDFPLDDLLG